MKRATEGMINNGVVTAGQIAYDAVRIDRVTQGAAAGESVDQLISLAGSCGTMAHQRAAKSVADVLSARCPSSG